LSRDRIREGRLSGERGGNVAAYLSSMEADRRIGRADIMVDIAHLIMLNMKDIIDRDSASLLMKELLKLYEDGIPEEAFDDAYEDVHAGKEAYLIREIGAESGGRLHIGRSRNDEVATCLRIRLREDIVAVLNGLLHLREELLELADEHINSIMPGFTHLQHAQPTTLAHHLLSYVQAFTRDFDRFRDTYRRVNICPLGSAAFASTGYPIDRKLTANLLGFGGIAGNSMDAVSSRDFALETLSAAAVAMTTASRLSEELVIWSSAFVRFAELDDIHSSTSSIMPQKKNPDTAEIMRGKCGTATGALVSALMIVKGLPMSYNRDLQELSSHLWQGMDAARESVSLLGEMIGSATFNTKRMAEEADRGFSTATELADIMVREHGLPFRTAHNIVGRAVRSGSITLESLEEAAMETEGICLKDLGLTGETVKNALDPVTGILARNVEGGPAPEAVTEQIRVENIRCDRDRRWVSEIDSSISSSERILIEKAKELV